MVQIPISAFSSIFMGFEAMSSILVSSSFTGFRAKFDWKQKTKRSLEIMAPSVRLQGVDDEMQKLLVSNMDEAPARRRAREAFKDIQLGLDHLLFKVLIFIGFSFLYGINLSCCSF